MSDTTTAEIRRRHPLQFSLADLLISMTLVALGVGGFVWLNGIEPTWSYLGTIAGLWYASSGLIGAGLLHPLKRTALGFVGGFAVMLLVAYWLHA